MLLNGFCWGAFGTLLLSASAPLARGDLFILKGGGEIEGEVLADHGDTLRIRTPIGTVDIERTQIERQVAAPSPWDRYQHEKRKYKQTAADQFALAQWCAKNGLRTEELEHLRETIKLDPDHAGARAALGFVHENGQWVKPSKRPPVDPAAKQAKKQAKAANDKVRKVVTEWFVQVKAIFRGRLDGESDPTSKRFLDGREQILAIREPLAIPAITSILSTGTELVRRLMIESLAQFKEDEATMNIVVAALLDPSAVIRQAATVELVGRKDPRIVETLRDALLGGEEPVLRNAATALGLLKAVDAVDDLIGKLSIETRKSVVVSGPVYLDDIRYAFGGCARYRCGGDFLWYQPDGIGCLGPGSLIGTTYWTEVHLVSIYRTEVQEALIKITGQNFGFDENAWRLWWKQNKPK